MLNGAYSSILLVHFATVFSMIPFFIYGLEHYAVSVPNTIFFIWCIVFQVIRIGAVWIPLGFVKAESERTLERLKGVALKMREQCLLKSYRCKLVSLNAFALNAGGLYDISVQSILTSIYFATMHMVLFVG